MRASCSKRMSVTGGGRQLLASSYPDLVILRPAFFAGRRTYAVAGGADAAVKVHRSFAAKNAAQDDKAFFTSMVFIHHRQNHQAFATLQ